ncbi:Glutamyl aminopeptidase [Trachymyrmex cornetzi]|uniref:Glutamyl aminopeptidase n=1 Tax=Trachymyrmex cornetzi TaxID=471704 RepID=A0A195DXS3_9HYME|nr:Glutamyl aminopeptidase [Trachymyrmex cornetzi]
MYKIRLPDFIYPVHYIIQLDLHNTTGGYISTEGRCEIHIQINIPTNYLYLHSNTSIHSLELKTLRKEQEEKNVLTFHPKLSRYNLGYDMYSYFFNKTIPPDSYSLTLKFKHEGENEGLFRTSFINNKGDTTWLVALDFLPVGARRIFPCWDEPRFLATFDISIEYKSNYTILSNTPTRNKTSSLRKFQESHFEVTPRIPTYHVSAILLSHFITVQASFFGTPSILRMLQLILSNDIFQKGIKTYLSEDPSLDDMTTIDAVWTAIQRAYNTSYYTGNSRIGLSIKQLMNAWTMQEHYPVVKVTQNNSHVTILVENMNTKEKNWWIPYTTATNANKHIPDFSLSTLQSNIHFSLVGEELNLNVESNWVIVNVQQIGYYRVHYDKTILGQISEYLNSDEHHINNIHVLNRAQIIDDAFYFFIRKETDLNVFLALTEYLQRETDFIAWYPMFKGLEYMSIFFHWQSSSYIKRNMLRIVNKIFVETIRYDSDYLFDITLKEEILRWTCIFGSFECKNEAYSRLQIHLKNQTCEDRLPDSIYPILYTIHLTLYDMNENISVYGTCIIDLKIKSPTQNISLHMDKSRISKLNFQELKPWYGGRNRYVPLDKSFSPVDRTYRNRNNVFTYIFKRELSPGSYSLNLTFKYREDSEGLFRTSFINDKGDTTWLAALDFLPIGARRIFPCFDEPRFQANFDIYITYNSAKYTILSNTPAIGPISSVFNKETIRFEMTPRIPTYHVSAILLSHFTTVGSLYFKNNTNLNIRYRQQLTFDYTFVARDAVEQVTSYFISQEHLKNNTSITHVLIPGFRHDAVSNLGLIYYKETAVIFHEEEDPLMRKPEIARLIGRSVAYQCFRNRISPSWWSYMWLIEGITTLLALDAIDENFQNFRIKDLFVVQTLQESLRFDDNFIMKPLIREIQLPSEIESIFSMSYYIKAPSILRMLQLMLSNEIFQKGIKTYLSEDPSLDDMTTIDAVWTAIQRAYDTSPISRVGLSVKQLMDVWTKQQHYPVVKVTQHNISAVKILIENMNTNEKDWSIPFTVVTNAIKHDPDFSVLTLSFSMHFPLVGEEMFLNHDSSNWIIVNVQQIGYYRVNYDKTTLGQISEYLNWDHMDKIHVLNRAQIIDDAFYFFMRKEIDLYLFLALTEYLQRETDFIAWYPMFKSLEYMSTFFHYQNSLHIKNHMLRIVNKIFVNIIKDDSDNLFKISLKEEISRWACILGSSECKKEAHSRLHIHLKNQTVSPWWKEWTYCNGLMIADNNTWYSALRNTHIRKLDLPDYMYFKFMACSEDFFIIRNYIEFIKSAEFYDERQQDYFQVYIFHSVVARHAKNDTMLDYILLNLDRIKPRYFYSEI